jgi:hypothetical protein
MYIEFKYVFRVIRKQTVPKAKVCIEKCTYKSRFDCTQLQTLDNVLITAFTRPPFTATSIWVELTLKGTESSGSEISINQSLAALGPCS